MELNNTIVDAPPVNAASVVLLRDSAQGMQVLLLRRHDKSGVLGGVWVFPGGKVDESDSASESLALLDRPPSQIAPLLGESALTPEAAASIFVAAAREAFEEAGVLLAHTPSGATQFIPVAQRTEAFTPLLTHHGLRLDTHSLAPWSHWITPRQPTVMNKRFDTRFMLAMLPHGQDESADLHEITEVRWLTPREALRIYTQREIDLAPPQIMSLFHLALYPNVEAAFADAHARLPYLMEPHTATDGGERLVCFPGDPAHPLQQCIMPGTLPTRLFWRDKHFVPPGGMQSWIS
jgi:8-oxo-dGTP pyrophosphatase MutT (NUDIX family)